MTAICIPKILTLAQAATARERSLRLNPSNLHEQQTIERTPIGRRGGPRRLALVIGRKWPATGIRLSVQFLDSPPRDLRARILSHMNAWSQAANVSFEETSGVGEVRIARLDAPADVAGYWSYVGTEILGIEDDQPTMNLEGFTMRTAESEFRRVVRHETGHTLGFDHEHMRSELVQKIDRRKAFAFYDLNQGWTREETLEQVLTPLKASSIMGTTEADPHSIMCYQVPASITKDGRAIPGGRDITEKDFAFIRTIYPPTDTARHQPSPLPLANAEPPSVRTTTSTLPALPLVPSVDADTFHLIIMDRFEPDAVSQNGASIPRAKFARVFASFGGARVTVPMRLNSAPGEDRTRFPDIIRMHERIKNYTNRESGSLPSDSEMVAFGVHLFETLFQGDVRRLYDEARSRQRGRRLDFVLTSMVPWIAEKPWEFAYDSARKSFLASEEIHFIRNVLTAIPADVVMPAQQRLRILVASAQPVGFGRLSIAQETEVIQRGFATLTAAGLAEVVPLARATPASIHEHLREGHFNVVHFIGHGLFDEKTQEGALVFENGRGGEYRLGERAVREIFCQRGVSLVFLNACQSGTGGKADFNKGIAQSLVAHGLPALVANQYSVLDSSATQFAQQFYRGLATGMTVGGASREARIAVNYSLQGDIIDWAVPVVYARDPNMRLFGGTPAASARQALAACIGSPATKAPRELEIAVWDIDSAFPDLAGTLARMEGAQGSFGFRLAGLSAPLDAWDLEHRAEDGTACLLVENVAARLGHVPLDLHADALVCVTRHWLRSQATDTACIWWPRPEDPPVVIVSFAGFDQLQPEGATTDRVIANLLVSALAGYFGKLPVHASGGGTCPMACGSEDSPRRLAGSLAFDRTCLARLKSQLPHAVADLQALLQAFSEIEPQGSGSKATNGRRASGPK